MEKKVLVANDSMGIVRHFTGSSDEFQITSTDTGKDALAALASSPAWCAVIAAAELPDMHGIDLLQQAALISTAVPLLMVPESQLAVAVDQANRHAIFRVLTESTDRETLETVLFDAAKQFRLIHQERQLRERIQQLTLTDPLTGCFTRAHLDDYLRKELARSVRYAHYLSLIHCDIDALREVNDAFGHRTGDKLLTAFAQLVLHVLRADIDSITRWGEDEFIILLPETPIRGAGRVASRICDQYGRLGFTSSGHPVLSTASFGVSGFSPEAGSRNATADELLLIASRCLLQAKAAGGNQVLCCP